MLLLGYGAAGLVGIVVSTRVVDARPRLAFALPTATIVMALTVLALIGRNPVLTAVAVVAWGGAFTTLPVVLQGSVLRVAPAISDVASAVYVVAFQIGIGGGAFVGGLLVDAGDLDATTGIAAGAALVALVVGLATRGLFPPAPPRDAAAPRDHSARCRRSASSSWSMTGAGTRPRTGPSRSTATDRTCSAWAFESTRSQWPRWSAASGTGTPARRCSSPEQP